MRTPVVLLVSAALLSLVPVAASEPQCLQVYPWSELCQGDVVGFVNAVSPCDLDECVTLSPPGGPTLDCIQVVPWSYLCSGNVEAFVEYYTGPIENILA